LGNVLTSGQQPTQQGQGHSMVEGSISGQHWLQYCRFLGQGEHQILQMVFMA
jgi:hypothetical protein